MHVYHKPYFKVHKALFPIKDTLGAAKQRDFLIKELSPPILMLGCEYTAHISY